MPKRIVPLRSVPKDQLWFHDPEMQARMARAREDFKAGRFTRTETLEEAQEFLAELKKKWSKLQWAGLLVTLSGRL
jgi:hypothetical protein